MMLRPSVCSQPRVAVSRPVWLLVAFFLILFVSGPVAAQEGEGKWRLVVRHNVTRGEAERVVQNLPSNLPGLEVVPLPNGAFAVHMGDFPNEDEAQRELERYFSQDGIRLGSVAFISSATPTPAPMTPTPTPSPTVTAPPPQVETPLSRPPEPGAGLTTFPAAPSSPRGELPLGLIAAIAAGVIVIGGGLYFFVLRKKDTPAPAPMAAPPRPVVSSLPPKPKPNPAIARPVAKQEPPKPADSEPEPKREPEPRREPEPAPAPVAIRFREQAPAEEPPPPAVKAPIALGDAPQIDPTPSIILNDIFADEPETAGNATPMVDEGASLDFLLDDEARAASAGGNGSSGTGDEGLGIPLGFGSGEGSVASPSTSEAPMQRVSPAASAGSGALLFEQDLSAAIPGQTPPGWTGNYDYAKLTVATGENGNGQPHLRFEKESGIGSAYYSCQFPDAHGRLAVDFEIRCEDKNKYLLGFYIEKDQDFRQSVHALIHRTNAKASPVLRLQNESVPYEFGTWRKVRYEIDLVRHLIDGFVDDEPVIVGQRLTSCPDGLNTLSIRDNLATTGVLLLRGIRITKLD